MSSQLRYARNWWILKVTKNKNRDKNNQNREFLNIEQLCNLSTLQREYTALLTSESFPLMQTIATGDCRNENKDVVNKISLPLMHEFKKMYNEFQMNALNVCLTYPLYHASFTLPISPFCIFVFLPPNL